MYDNNSTDQTAEIARKHNAIVRFEPRQGKGNVVRQMFRDIEADYYVLVDGDDTYPAQALQSLLEPLLEGRANITLGDRLVNLSYQSENKRRFHGLGNNLVRSLISAMYSVKLFDIITGYRGFSRHFVKTFPIVSKLSTFKDGAKVMLTILTLFKDYKPLALFTIIGLLLALVGLVLGVTVVIEYFQTGLVERFPTALLSVAFIIAGLLSIACGLILDTTVKGYRKEYELVVLREYERANRNKE